MKTPDWKALLKPFQAYGLDESDLRYAQFTASSTSNLPSVTAWDGVLDYPGIFLNKVPLNKRQEFIRILNYAWHACGRTSTIEFSSINDWRHNVDGAPNAAPIAITKMPVHFKVGNDALQEIAKALNIPVTHRNASQVRSELKRVGRLSSYTPPRGSYAWLASQHRARV
jgi:hypothetical protein